jgi:hypothetical protein
MTIETLFSTIVNLFGLLFFIGSMLAAYFAEVQEPVLVGVKSRVLTRPCSHPSY